MHRLADAAQQHQPHAPGLHLLVDPHVVERALGADLRRLRPAGPRARAARAARAHTGRRRAGPAAATGRPPSAAPRRPPRRAAIRRSRWPPRWRGRRCGRDSAARARPARARRAPTISRLDLAGAADRVRQRRRRRARAARRCSASSQSKNAASQIRPYLMTSASPALQLARRAASRSSSVSAITARG